MKKTDYSKIASKYDKNEKRKITSPDPVLKDLIKESALKPFTVLDLGCGTGTYLAFNTACFKDADIAWYGLDASEDMLTIAKEKTGIPQYFHGDAHSLPYENGFFDYVTTEFAFHHFEDKTKVLDEMTRVLKKHAVLSMKNLETSCSSGWWVYTCFPETRCEDFKRFWETDLIVYELENREFSVEVTIEIFRKRVSISDILKTARARDISELNIITEKQYEAGIAKMENECNHTPNAMIMNEFSLLELVAQKG